MNINVKQTIWLGVAFLVVALIVFVFGFAPMVIDSNTASTIIGALIIAFVAITGGFLGLDLAHLIGTTSFLPAGVYQTIDAWKYIVCSAMLFLLFSLLLWVQLEKPLIGLGIPMMSTGFGGLILLGALILGVQVNKIATGIPPATTTTGATAGKTP